MQRHRRGEACPRPIDGTHVSSVWLRHREALREVVREVVRNRFDVEAAAMRIAAWVAANIETGEGDRFREIAETELLDLHAGNYARYRVPPGEFDAWREVWDARSKAPPTSSVRMRPATPAYSRL